MISFQELKELLAVHKVSPYRAKQIFHAVYKEGIGNFDQIKTVPKELRTLLEKNSALFSFTVEKEVNSKSGDTIKTLFRLNDGKLVEGVLMRFRDGRNSVCVSSQVGCGLRCSFCATGTMGFIRNLTSSEIADQVLYFDQLLKGKRSGVNHVIFMGMGEPFLNYEEVMKAVSLLNDPGAFGIAARHITLSTSGVIPGISKLTNEKMQVNLAVSLHAPNQALRESFMPIARSYKLPALMESLELYSKKTHRRISYEYVMLKNINDSPKLASELGRLIRGQRCHVNLIPYNETYLGFSNAGKSRIDRFREIVESYGIPVTVRVSLGQDISAACGQLAIKK